MQRVAAFCLLAVACLLPLAARWLYLDGPAWLSAGDRGEWARPGSYLPGGAMLAISTAALMGVAVLAAAALLQAPAAPDDEED